MAEALTRNFGSDNVSPVCVPILSAIKSGNAAPSGSYGADLFTERLTAAVSRLFETDVAIFPVATGTAANALSLAQLAPPYGGGYCHAGAHIVTDECGAPESLTGGALLLGLPSSTGKIGPQTLSAAVAFAEEMGVHHVRPSAVSVTQATELGTVYGLEELSALTAAAKRHGLNVHMDGARFANALVHLGCTPAEATWKRGIDVLSLGASKNGALCAEAVVFFNRALAEGFERRRKQAGHLWSKLRYLSCQLLAYPTTAMAAQRRPRRTPWRRGSPEAWPSCHSRGCSRTSRRTRYSWRYRNSDRAPRAGGFSFLSLAAHPGSRGCRGAARHVLHDHRGRCGRLLRELRKLAREPG